MEALRGLTRIELRRGLSDLRGGKGGGGGQSGGDDGDGLHVWIVLFLYDDGVCVRRELSF